MLPRTVKRRQRGDALGCAQRQPRRDLQLQRRRADERAAGQPRDGAQRARVLRPQLRRPRPVGAGGRARRRSRSRARRRSAREIGASTRPRRRRRSRARELRGLRDSRASRRAPQGDHAGRRQERVLRRERGGPRADLAGSCANSASPGHVVRSASRWPAMRSNVTARPVGVAVGRPAGRGHLDAAARPARRAATASTPAARPSPARRRRSGGDCENVPRFATPVETPL